MRLSRGRSRTWALTLELGPNSSCMISLPNLGKFFNFSEPPTISSPEEREDTEIMDLDN